MDHMIYTSIFVSVEKLTASVQDYHRVIDNSRDRRQIECYHATDTSSMHNWILKGLQQKLQKSCSRCNKTTLHLESGYILQPPKYVLLFDNRFRYFNNKVTKDRCSIHMDLVPLNLAYGLL